MKLSIRQRKYKKNIILGMNCYNAAIAAGYSESTAKSRTKRLNELIKIGDILERQGLTDKALVGKLVELIEASDVVFKRDSSGNKEIVGDAKLYSPNWKARAKGLELALKMKDLLTEKVEHKGLGDTRIVIINPKDENSSQRIPAEIHI